MDQDDYTLGRIFTRREALAVLGSAGLTFLSGGDLLKASSQAVAAPCVNLIAVPSSTEGPFFVDEKLNRSNLLADTSRPSVINGLPLQLQIRVYELTGGLGCPLAGAQVDIWHCDAAGVYSDEPAGSIQSESTVGQKWLRGFQITDADGLATFDTIYPGWYTSRTIHIHFKVRRTNASQQVTYDFTSQFYFADALNDAIMSNPPYNSRGTRNVRNTSDGLYRPELTMNVSDNGAGKLATFALGVDSTQATPTPAPTPSSGEIIEHLLNSSGARTDYDINADAAVDVADVISALI